MQVVRVAIAALAMVWLSVPVSAQQTTGTVLGKVSDEQGAVIPGATVSASNPSTGFNRTAVSDAEGVYRLNALPVGQYDLAVELADRECVRKRLRYSHQNSM